MTKLLAGSLLLVSSLAFADAAYSVTLATPPGKKAQKGVVKIHVSPGAGYHVNKEYPTAMSLSAVPAGVSVEKLKLTGKDAVKLDESGIEFEVAYTSTDAGKKVFTGDLRFAVCSASSCDPKHESLNFTVDVK
ncbi:MAG TPA: hypothetical protein VFF06_23950 [Polyangia bacterium]|nr:hypothetical protein [Polyangia bacterium]